MDFHQMTNIMYELMRVKEDRLLMSWEDDRGHFVRSIQSLQETNVALLHEQERQNVAYHNLLSTIASFNPISSTNLSPITAVCAGRNRASDASNSVQKRARSSNEDEGDFISINRNKHLKKGPMDSFFNSSTNALAGKAVAKPATANRAKLKASSAVPEVAKQVKTSSAIDPNDTEWWNVPVASTASNNVAIPGIEVTDHRLPQFVARGSGTHN